MRVGFAESEAQRPPERQAPALQEARAGRNLCVPRAPQDPRGHAGARGHFMPAGLSLLLISATWAFKTNPNNAS